MSNVQIKIPEGFEIDPQKSDLTKGIIEFKPVEKKKLTYEEIAKKLFSDSLYFTGIYGQIDHTDCPLGTFVNPNNATSKEQIECLMAFNKLRNVAEYLNKGWKADWNNSNVNKWAIYFDNPNWKIAVSSWASHRYSSVYFATKELALEAIEILGEEMIKKSLFIY